MTVLIPYINLLNLSWVIKCLFLRNTEPLKKRIPELSSNTPLFYDYGKELTLKAPSKICSRKKILFFLETKP